MPIVEYNNDLDTFEEAWEPDIDFMNYSPPPSYCECLVNGIRIKYDACSSYSRFQAKKSYEHAFKYIGSGYTYWVNGKLQIANEEHHFFVEYNNNERRVLVEKIYGLNSKTFQQ